MMGDGRSHLQHGRVPREHTVMGEQMQQLEGSWDMGKRDKSKVFHFFSLPSPHGPSTPRCGTAGSTTAAGRGLTRSLGTR